MTSAAGRAGQDRQATAPTTGGRRPGPGPGNVPADPEDAARASTAARNAQQAVTRARRTASNARLAAESHAQRTRLVRELFAQPTRDYLHQVLGRPVGVLRAGVGVPIEELGLQQLRASGYDISVTTVDQNDPAICAAAGRAAGSPAPVLGDLRAIPLAPRSFDIVHCGLLLDRIPHAELVLDRLIAALRPGGLLLLRIRDRDCAAGLLERLTPDLVRRMVWARLRADEPGPFPAIYDPVSSDHGIQAYTVSHGLVIIRREAARTVPGPPGRLSSATAAARTLIAWLSRSRLTDAHDELLYVIRKPEDHFARLVLVWQSWFGRPRGLPGSPRPGTIREPARRGRVRSRTGYYGTNTDVTATDMTRSSVWLYGRGRAGAADEPHAGGAGRPETGHAAAVGLSPHEEIALAGVRQT